ncbi:hypothetical protein EPUL_005400, partial [Erysiphe pulchra]
PVNAAPSHDAFGVTNYGFQCFSRVYPKFVLFAATKRYCDITKIQPSLRSLIFKDAEYRNKNYFRVAQKLFKPVRNSIIPILEDGTFYPFEFEPELRMVQNSAGEMIKKDLGPDRLVIDMKCNIIGAFSDLDYENKIAVGRVKNCTVLKSIEDYISPFVSGTPERSPPRSPQRSREQSP